MRAQVSRGWLLCLAWGIAGLHAVSAAAADELHWYRGNTHTHTRNSDGKWTPDAVVRWYREHRYQFLFITDHEYVTDPAPLNAMFGASERFLLLPGQEITQWSRDPSRQSAHVNSLFTTKVIWPIGERSCLGGGCGAHVDPTVALSETFKTNIAAVRAARGIAQINHPNFMWSVKPEDLYEVPDGCLIEVWNGGEVNNLGGTNDSGDARPSAEGYWDILLSRGKVMWGVASDDSHSYSDVDGAGDAGHGWIMVHAPELSSDAIKAALAQGRFYASTGVTLDGITAGPTELSFTIVEMQKERDRYLTRFIGQDGNVLAEVPGTHPTYTIKGNEHYVRASVMDSNGERAWTQPVFTDGRSRARDKMTRASD